MTIYSAASGMVLEQRRQELIARNLAGSQISGYKREHLVSSNFKADLDRERMVNTNKFQGTTGGKEHVDLTQGAIKKTSDPLDFAIHGEGFFELETPDGQTLYTRNGQFQLNTNGELTNTEGFVVQGVNGPIQLDPSDDISNLRISPDGEITIDVNNGSERTILGRFRIVAPEDQSILTKVSSSMFKVEKGKENMIAEVDTVDPNFQIINGSLETSNASPIKDMVNMVQSMREFEMGQKMLKMLDESGKQLRQKLG